MFFPLVLCLEQHEHHLLGLKNFLILCQIMCISHTMYGQRGYLTCIPQFLVAIIITKRLIKVTFTKTVEYWNTTEKLWQVSVWNKSVIKYNFLNKFLYAILYWKKHSTCQRLILRRMPYLVASHTLTFPLYLHSNLTSLYSKMHSEVGT